MPKANNIVTTAQSQHAELLALMGGAQPDTRVTELEEALRTAIAKQADLTGELEAEKEAHQKTQAALAAATAAPAQ